MGEITIRQPHVKDMSASDEYPKAFDSAADYESLKVRFGKHGWHGTNVRGLALMTLL
jgi:hypothetical protein